MASVKNFQLSRERGEKNDEEEGEVRIAGHYGS
jgi:hypothetical protein